MNKKLLVIVNHHVTVDLISGRVHSPNIVCVLGIFLISVYKYLQNAESRGLELLKNLLTSKGFSHDLNTLMGIITQYQIQV